MYLIVGGDSLIGSALSAYWVKKGVLHEWSTRNTDQVTEARPYLDLSSKTWQSLEGKYYSAVVLCAAITKLSDCEKNPVMARNINVLATTELAKLMSSRGSHILLLSTSQVFDGNSLKNRFEYERVCPVTEYGRQKAEAERCILELPQSTVLRLTKVTHPGLAILAKWQSSLEAGRPIEAFVDLNLAPIPLANVVTRIDELIGKCETGVFHLFNECEISYYEFAREYFKYIPNSEFLIKKSYLHS